MNERQLFDAIGRVDDDLILAADRPAVRRRKKPVYWMPALSAAACAGLLMVGVAKAASSLGSSRLRRLSTLWHVLTVMRISHGRTASQLRSVWMCA